MAYGGSTLPATGEVVAQDEILFAGTPRKVQLVKLGTGAESVFIALELGEKPKSGSLPVVLASDQALAVSLSAGNAIAGGFKLHRPTTAELAVPGNTFVDVDAPLVGAITSVTAVVAPSSATLLAENANRKGATIYNNSTAVLYLALSNITSSPTVYTLQMAAGSYFELPFARNGPYRGFVKGTWAALNGGAQITELT